MYTNLYIEAITFGELGLGSDSDFIFYLLSTFIYTESESYVIKAAYD